MDGQIWPGLHPYSFTEDILGLFVSQDLGLTTHPDLFNSIGKFLLYQDNVGRAMKL